MTFPPVVVVCPLIENGEIPDGTRARGTCMGCPEWVWLNADALRVVIEYGAQPFCDTCAALHITSPEQIIGPAATWKPT